MLPRLFRPVPKYRSNLGVSLRATTRPRFDRSFHQTMVNLVNKQDGLNLLKEGKITEASKVFAQLQNSGDADVVAQQALCICQDPARFGEAEALAVKALSLGANEPPYQIIHAAVLREIGKADLAVKNLLILSDFYNSWQLQYELGRSLNRNWQRFGPAILAFNKSLAINPANPDAYYWRGEAQYWLDQCNDDPFAWLADDALFEGHARGAFYRGLRSYREGKFEEAFKHFEKANIGTKNDTSDLWSWRGEALLSAGQLDQALAAFEKAVSINAADCLSLHGQGEVHGKKGDSQKKFDLQVKALELNRLYWKSDYFRVKNPAVEGVS